MSASKSSSSNYYYSSSEGSSSSESSMGTLELASDYFETIHDLDVGIHIVYNPHTISTYNNTHRYIPTTIRETPVYAHSPKKNYKDINGEDLWRMACYSLENTEHESKDGDDIIMSHTCDPAMDGEYFAFDKLNSTTNFIILNISEDPKTREKQMKTFVLCRDLDKTALKKMRTKARQDEYEYNGDFLDYMKVKPEPCLYIDGLCSKERGVAGMLMEMMSVMVEKSLVYDAVKLASLTYVVKYYYKLGYRFANSPNVAYYKNINDPSLFEKVNKMVEELPKITKDDEFTNPKWVAFVNFIQEYKLFNTDFDTRIKKNQKRRMKRGATYYDAVTDKFIKYSPKRRKTMATKSHDIGANGWYMDKKFDKKKQLKSRKNTPPRAFLTRKRLEQSKTKSKTKSKVKSITRKRQKTRQKTKSRGKTKKN